MRLVLRSGLVATVLAVGVVAAPAASADPSHSGWNPAPSALVVRSNPDEQAAQVLAGTAAHRASSESRSGPAGIPNSDRIATERAATSISAPLYQFGVIHPGNITPPTSPVVSRNPEGFQFGDAGIGAGVVVVLVALGTVGMLAVRRRRQPLHT